MHTTNLNTQRKQPLHEDNLEDKVMSKELLMQDIESDSSDSSGTSLRI